MRRKRKPPLTGGVEGNHYHLGSWAKRKFRRRDFFQGESYSEGTEGGVIRELSDAERAPALKKKKRARKGKKRGGRSFRLKEEIRRLERGERVLQPWNRRRRTSWEKGAPRAWKEQGGASSAPLKKKGGKGGFSSNSRPIVEEVYHIGKKGGCLASKKKN